ncbi:MAG: aminotransferase class V-fold PLP-dependent enzyme [Azospirillaceae bacterium]
MTGERLERHYLDYNASAPLLPAARAAHVAALDLTGNPSSVHAHGRAVRALVEEARREVAAALGVDAGQVVFTAGATEANGWALQGCGRPVRLASAVEHVSVLAQPGVETMAVDGDGVIDLPALQVRARAAGERGVLSLMLANNETGVIQPVREAARVARAAGLLVHCDATQAVGRLSVDMAELGVDMLTLSAHKIGGPKGAGALVLREGLALEPLLRGGGQERRRRAGTENVPAIAGFGAAIAAQDIAGFARLAGLRDRLESAVVDIEPAARFPGQATARLANTSVVALPGVPSETQLMAFDLAGIAVSAGSACSSGKVETSHVLRAMGVPEDIAGSAIRVSLGPQTPEAAIDAFVVAWRALRRRQAASRAA